MEQSNAFVLFVSAEFACEPERTEMTPFAAALIHRLLGTSYLYDMIMLHGQIK